MVDSDTLRGNLKAVRAAIVEACARSGRRADEVRLIGVTKTMPPEVVALAIELGMKDLGENYIQEASLKAKQLPPVNWHFIGHLQRNKAGQAVSFASYIHSLDSLGIIKAVDRRCEEHDVQVKGLIQVHLGDESTKSGVGPEELWPLLDELAQDPPKRLQLVGLMTVPPPVSVPEDNRPHFRHLRQLLQEIVERDYPFWRGRELSMGMSDDYLVAIEEGSTMVRVGRSLFGERPPKVVSG